MPNRAHQVAASLRPERGPAARVPRTLRGTLRWLLIAPLVPLALVSGVFVWTQWQASRAVVYTDLSRAAKSLARSVDQEVEIGKAVLDTLAASELIDRRDWEGFRRLALQALRDRPDSWIALGDATGLQVMRTFEPVGSPAMNPSAFARQNAEIEWRGRTLPVSTQGLSERILKTARPSNPGLYFGAAIRRPAVAIGVPVIRDARATHVLILGFAPDRLAQLVLQADGNGQKADLVDANGRLIASSRDPQDGMGLTVLPEVRERLALNTDGFREGPDRDGVEVVAAYQRAELTDWSVLASSARDEAFAPAWRVFTAWTVLLLALLALSAWAASALWLRLAPPLVAMGRAARAIQQGTPPELPPSGIAEIEELGALLRDAASAEARNRDEALRRAAAEEQALAQARFRAAIEHLPHGVVIYDAQRRYEYLNGQAVELYGRARDAFIGQRDEALWPPAIVAPYVDALERAIATRTVQSLEWPLPDQATGDRVIAVTHAPLADDDGRLRQVLTIAWDLTERKRAERVREASEQLLRRVLDNLDAFVGVLDVQGRLLEANRAPLERARLTRGEVIGRPFWEWPWWTHDPRVQRQLRHAVGRAAAGEAVRYDVAVRIADNVLIAVDFLVAPLRDASGAVSLVVASGVDITERKRTEAALREADRQKDEFLAILSHELRNPLAPIRAASHVIRARVPDDPMLTRAGEIIERQVGQLVRLVDDLLEVSRITQGRIELRTRPEPLAAVVSAAVESARPTIEAAGHRFEVSLPAVFAIVEADTARLSQAILNVLQNAAKYTPRGGRISLEVTVGGGCARIAVTDDGIGIDARTLPRIFEMFVQGDRDAGGARGGLGIGLALARRLVEMHGGSITASSDGPGHGSRFVIELPLVPASEPALDAPTPPAPLDAAATSHRTVLVVDDNVDAADTLGTLLSLDGHVVRIAHDGRSALAAVAAHRPDAVLLDIGLPDIDGLEVARRLRTTYGIECPRLIALSGWGQASDKQRALDAGFERHFTKPVEPATLAAVLSQRASDPLAAA